MSHPTFPVELLYKIADWLSDFGDTSTLKELALAARCFVPYVQGLLFRHITFSISRERTPAGLLNLLDTRPDLTLQVKSVTLNQLALRLTVAIEALHKLHNVEKITILGGTYLPDDSLSSSQFVSKRTFSWNSISRSMAESLLSVGQNTPRLREFVFRDIDELPINKILENFPQLVELELLRTNCAAERVDPSHSLKSFRWTFDHVYFMYGVNPSSEWLLGPSLTHLHLLTKTGSPFQTKHQPSCGLLGSLRSLILEIHHDGAFSVNVAAHSFPILLHALETVPNSAPFEDVTLVLRDVRNDRHGWGTSGDWKGIDTTVADLGDVLVKRHVPLRKVRVQIFGFPSCRDTIRDALAVITAATEIEVTIDEKWIV